MNITFCQTNFDIFMLNFYRKCPLLYYILVKITSFPLASVYIEVNNKLIQIQIPFNDY